jgi:hypothetical protein
MDAASAAAVLDADSSSPTLRIKLRLELLKDGSFIRQVFRLIVTLRDVERYRGVKANHLDLNVTRRKLRESTASLISTIASKGYYDELLSAVLNVSSDFTPKSAEELDTVKRRWLEDRQTTDLGLPNKIKQDIFFQEIYKTGNLGEAIEMNHLAAKCLECVATTPLSIQVNYDLIFDLHIYCVYIFIVKIYDCVIGLSMDSVVCSLLFNKIEIIYLMYTCQHSC